LITLALIWGGSFLAIKVAVAYMSPEVLLLLRSLTGFLALALIIRLSGRPLFGPGWRNRVGSFAIMAVTNSVVPWIAIAWGEQHIGSGLASILNATTTLWTAVLIFWVVPSERPARSTTSVWRSDSEAWSCWSIQSFPRTEFRAAFSARLRSSWPLCRIPSTRSISAGTCGP
jgi:drug/metabolite transporter (DMT)-like permease